MVQSLNQFAITPEAGDAVFSPVEPLNVRLASTATNVAAGTFVKPVGTSESAIVVAPCAPTDANYLGVVKRNIRKAPAQGGDIIGVLCVGSIVYIPATAAITAGSKVEIATGGVMTSAGTNPTVGLCLNAPAQNGLAMVQLLPAVAA